MMIIRFSRIMSVVACLALTGVAIASDAIPQEFTYQALITNSSGLPVTSANTSVTLDLYDASVAGNLIKSQTFTGLNLTNTGGYVNLTITPVLPELRQALYVEVTVENVALSTAPETLTPRQKLSSVPYALLADSSFPNRTLIVNPAPPNAQSATPKGTISDPFVDIAAAYAKAKTMAPSYQNRVVVMLMPGKYTVNTPIVLDTQAIDITGFNGKSAVITGTADPAFDATAPGSTGVTIRSMTFQLAPAATNRAIRIRSGRLIELNLNRQSASAATAGTLLEVACVAVATDDVSVNQCEIYGDVLVTNFGQKAAFSEGFILGTVTSAAPSAALGAMLAFTDMSNIANVVYTPSAPGLIVFGNCASVNGFTNNALTVVKINSSAFISATTGLPIQIGATSPLAGSGVASTVGGIAAWTGTAAASTGNVANEYVAYFRK